MEFCQIKDDLSNEQKESVEELLQIAEEKDCEKAVRVLEAKEELSLEKTRDMVPIQSFGNLKTLILTGTVDNLSCLKNLTNLERLKIQGTNSIKDLRPIAQLKNLKEITGIEESQIEIDKCPISAISPGVARFCSLKDQNFYSNSIKTDVQKYIADFESYKKEYLTFEKRLMELTNYSAYDKSKLSSEAIGGILYLKTEVLALELEHRTRSREIENESDSILLKLENPLMKFRTETIEEFHLYSGLFSNEASNGILELSQLKAGIRASGILAKNNMQKFSKQSDTAMDQIQNNADRLLDELAQMDFEAGTSSARKMRKSAEFIQEINKKIAFVFQETPSSRVFELPLLAQFYSEANELLDYSKVCPMDYNDTNSWMQTGCIVLDSVVNGTKKRLASFPDEIRDYLKIANSVLENNKNKVSDWIAAIEKLLNAGFIEKAVETYDAFLIEYSEENSNY